jgi:hypothetical protein
MATKTFPPTTTVFPRQLYQNSDGSWSTVGPPTPYLPGLVTYEDRAKEVDWRALIRNGNDATTEAHGLRRIWKGSQTDLLARHVASGSLSGRRVIEDSGLSMAPPVHSDYARQLAIGDFIGKCKETQHAFGAGEFLGELKETIRFLGNPLTAFRRYTSNYYRRMQGRATWVGTRQSKRKRIASAWLAYRFGVMPILSDLDSAMLELAQLTVGRPPSLPVRGKSFESSATVQQSVSTYWDLESTWDRCETTRSVTTIRGRVDLNMPTQVIWTPGTIRVFEEFIPTLWECMPWSWAFDYFSNIGDIISALTYLETNVLWANMTQRSEKVHESKLSFKLVNQAPWAGWVLISSQGCDATTSLTVWDRTRISPASLVPSLVFKTPFGKPLKMANLIAALTLRFKKS